MDAEPCMDEPCTACVKACMDAEQDPMNCVESVPACGPKGVVKRVKQLKKDN